MSTMPAWVRLALLRIPRYFCSYFRSTLNGPCTLWNGRYKNKGLDALCDRITLLACCSIEKETQVRNWFGNVLLTWFSLIFWSWQDGFVKLLLSVSWVNKLLSSFYVKYFCHRDSSPSIFWSPKLAQKERTSLSRFFFIYSYFEKLLSEKMCSRQSRKVIWDMFNTLFLTLWLSNLLLLLSFSTRRHTSMASSAILSNFFEKQSLKTIHNTFRGCRVHFIRRPFSKQLYISVGNCRAHYRHIFMHKANLSTASLHCVRAGCELRQ